MCGPPTCPIATPKLAFPFGGPPGTTEKQRHGEIRRAVGQHIRRVGDCNAVFARRLEINVVEAHTEACNDLHPRLWSKKVRRYGIGDGCAQRIGTLKRNSQLFVRERVIVYVESDFKLLAQYRFHVFRPAPGNDHFRHRSTSFIQDRPVYRRNVATELEKTLSLALRENRTTYASLCLLQLALSHTARPAGNLSRCLAAVGQSRYLVVRARAGRTRPGSTQCTRLRALRQSQGGFVAVCRRRRPPPRNE